MKQLIKYGWDTYFEFCYDEYFRKNASKENFTAGRVAVQNKNNYILYAQAGELTAEISGKFYFNSENDEDMPVVGDWVIIRTIIEEKKALIEHVLPRKNKFSRNSAGIKTDEQIIVANIDSIFIMTSLNLELNLRRLERYLTLAWDNQINPVILLSKSDLCGDYQETLASIESIAFNTPIHAVSSVTGLGIDELYLYFKNNSTVAVTGSSGVGKSTLINKLNHNHKLKVNDISSYKDKGKHTTTRREMFMLPGGGMIIDNPGMRELQLWESSEGLSGVFADIEEYLDKCKFTDCKHDSEPGCAVRG
ncbi:MAG: ribosome small subunit-dependent GTPase A, partial [Ignavibacteria bacterium]